MKQLTVILVACAAFAANELEGPSLGWMWDREAKTLRRLSGLPGALRNELGIDLGEGVRAVWIAPAQNFALVARDSEMNGNMLERCNLLTGETARLKGEVPDAVIFSPDGLRLGLWSKSGGHFTIWGEAPQQLDAAQIALANDGEILILSTDGLLRSSRGAALGNYSAAAAIALDANRLAVAGGGALVVFEKANSGWEQRSRREESQINGWTQIELESNDSILAVTSTNRVERWNVAEGEPQTLAEDGVQSLTRLRQRGFYLAEGESKRILFALSVSQKLYSLPTEELR